MSVWTNIRRAFSVEGEEKWISFGTNYRLDNRIIFLAILVPVVYFFFLNVSVFLDDVFVYFRVARNIIDGTGPVLNAGDHHLPVTSPLWVFLLVFLKTIFRFIDLVLLSKIIFIICLGMASFLAFLLLRRYVGTWAVLTPIPIFFNFISVTTVGGEIALVYLSLFAILWAYYLKRDFLLTGLAAAVAYLARPELILILPVIALHYLLLWKKENRTIHALLIDWGKFFLVFLFIVSIWHLYYAGQFHSIFPNTLKTKITQGKSGMWTLYYSQGRPLTLDLLARKYGLVIPLLFGLIYFREISLSLLLFTTLHYYAYKLLTVPYYHWYFYDFFILIPMFTLFGMIGLSLFLWKLARIYARSRQPKRKFPIFLKISATLLVFLLAVHCTFITTKVKCLTHYRIDSRLRSYKKIADWIRPKVRTGDTVLAPEIGIIGYYLENAIIRDTNGIASPDVNLENINNLDYFVKTYSPRFIFFPHFMNQKKRLKYFVDNQGHLLKYKLEFPHKKISPAIDCIFCLRHP